MIKNPKITKSKFQGWAILPFIIILFLLFHQLQILNTDTPLYIGTLFICISIYLIITIFFLELRTKVIKVSIENDRIIKKSFLGLGLPKVYKLANITGYKISNISSKVGTYEYLYLIANSKKVVKISEFYHRNYEELKIDLIQKDIKNLGIEQWSFVRETKETFE